MFAKPGLHDLQQLDLSHCGVEEVHLQAFLGLSDLNQLDTKTAGSRHSSDYRLA